LAVNRIRVIVVDDEPLARRGLRQLCEQDPDLELVCECADGRAAVAAIQQTEPDLLLLDIQMPGLDGFGVLRTVGLDRIPQVIFVTAYDRFAIRAFEVHALDYLLKPVDDERFSDAIERAKRMIHRPDLNNLQDRLLDLASELGLRLSREGVPAGDGRRPSPSGRPYISRIPVRKKGSVQMVRVEDVAWIEADNYLVRIHAGGKVHVLRETMKSLESRLESTRFFRVSRSAIVNLDRITEIQPFARGSHVIILDDGTRVLLSRGRRETLETLLGQSL
jgi:two-component system LytT family response regulator